MSCMCVYVYVSKRICSTAEPLGKKFIKVKAGQGWTGSGSKAGREGRIGQDRESSRTS